jgi:hypothetical protein
MAAIIGQEHRLVRRAMSTPCPATSGGVNPTSTIQALALYIADSIKKRLATLFD